MKIFDTFCFMNEIEILELRLMELYDTVDYFVIVEANRSHNGTPKEFIFEQNMGLYEKYLDKVIYVKVENMPEYDLKDIFKLEYFQRRQIMRGLHGKAKIGDKILMSDCDEIPNVKAIKECLKFKNRWILFKQDLFYYFVNNYVKRGWGGTVMADFGSFGNDPQRLRAFAKRHSWVKDPSKVAVDGGWHYSYMTGGDAKRVRDKVALFAEKHLLEIAGSVEDVSKKINTQKDLYDREKTKVTYIEKIVDISNNKPRTLDKFLEKYPNFIYQDCPKCQNFQ